MRSFSASWTDKFCQACHTPIYQGSRVVMLQELLIHAHCIHLARNTMAHYLRNEGLRIIDIADKLECSERTVYRYL